MVRIPAVLLVASFGALVGCAGAYGRAAHAEAGATAIRIVNDLDDTYALSGVTMRVDDMVLPVAAIPPRGASPRSISTLRLAPGEHSVSIRASATSAVKAECVVIEAQQAFVAGAEPSTITAHVFTKKPSQENLEEAVAFEIRVEGGPAQIAAGAGLSDPALDRCAPKAPLERAICRANADLQEAKRNNDVVAAVCVRSKLTEMLRLGAIRDASMNNEIGGLVAMKVDNLSREVDDCVAASMINVPMDPTTPQRPTDAPLRPGASSARR